MLLQPIMVAFLGQIFILARVLSRGNLGLAAALNQTGKTLAKRLLWLQAAVVLLLAIGAFATFSLPHAIGVVAGGITVIIPAIIFAWRAFAVAGARSAERIVRSFGAGQNLKFVITVLLLAGVLNLLTLPVAGILTGFIIAIAMQFVGPILLFKFNF